MVTRLGSEACAPAYPRLVEADQLTRAALLDVSEALGLASAEPVATLIECVSGWDPRYAGPDDEHVIGAGLLAITVGARLPGLDGGGAIAEVRSWSAERQLRDIVQPYFSRFPLSADTTAERLHRLSFLPAYADEPDFTLLGHRHGTRVQEAIWQGCVVRWNLRDSWVSWSHVDAEVAKVRARAGGAWVNLAGELIEQGFSS